MVDGGGENRGGEKRGGERRCDLYVLVWRQ